MPVVDEKAINKAVSARIRARRIDLKLTQQALADLSGVARTKIAMIESDAQRPTIALLYQLAPVLKCSPHDLLPSGPDHEVDPDQPSLAARLFEDLMETQ